MFSKPKNKSRIRGISEILGVRAAPTDAAVTSFPKFVFTTGVVAGVCLCLTISGLRGCGGCVKAKTTDIATEHIVHPDPVWLGAVRPAPDTFPRDTNLPNIPEGKASGSNDPRAFSPGRDLVYFDDPRVWWKSDHRATNDTSDECAHTMHRSMAEPFTRLVNLVSETEWTLKVQGCYSAESGVHSANTLHKQGRAIDLTFGDPKNPSERLDAKRLQPAYEQLAKLAWQAGFDWVY
ncbi:MAG: hypothetical protein FWG05_00240, partial [Kiritimatiellaeota bacterium]|nr:hypothetical protein [Kiritimatiellota bacterium]